MKRGEWAIKRAKPASIRPACRTTPKTRFWQRALSAVLKVDGNPSINRSILSPVPTHRATKSAAAAQLFGGWLNLKHALASLD